MASFLKAASTVLGAQDTGSRLSRIVGVDAAPVAPAAPAAKPSTLAEFMRDLRTQTPDNIPDTAGTAVGLAAGAFLWKRHRFLGAIGGASLGRNLPALLKPEHRWSAIRNLLTTGAGVGGSLLAPRNRIVGFVLGSLAGGLATYFTIGDKQ